MYGDTVSSLELSPEDTETSKTELCSARGAPFTPQSHTEGIFWGLVSYSITANKIGGIVFEMGTVDHLGHRRRSMDQRKIHLNVNQVKANILQS